MALPTGTITMAQVNVELSNPSSSNISLNQTAVRALAQIPSGTISMDDLRGASAGLSATGGTVYTGPNYKLHAFTSPGQFVVTNVGPGAAEYVVIGGGGGGGGQGMVDPNSNTARKETSAVRQGGGGAGGYRSGSMTVSATTYAVTVGSKGGVKQDGGSSSFGSISASGGGKGGFVQDTQACTGSQNAGGPGGSGGGGHCTTETAGQCSPICPSLPPFHPTYPTSCGGCTPPSAPPICFQIPPTHPAYAEYNCAGQVAVPSPGGTGNAGQYSPSEGNPGAASPQQASPYYYQGVIAPLTGGGAGGGGAGGSGNSNGDGGTGVVAPTRFRDQLSTDNQGYVAGGGSAQILYPPMRPPTKKAAGSYSWGGGRWNQPAASNTNPSNESGHDGIVVVSYPT